MNLAFAVKNLGGSQLNFDMIRKSNDFLINSLDTDIIAFFESIAKPCIPMNFASMGIMEGWGFDGCVVATSLSTAEKVLRFPSPAKRLFYCYDLEWARKSYAQEELRAIYGNPRLTLVARGLDHQKVISQAWNREVLLVEDFDIKSFLSIAHEE